MLRNRVLLAGRTDADGVPGLVMDYQTHDADAARLRYLGRQARQILRAAGAADIAEHGSGYQLGSRHLHGTCRAGADPRTSVVDRWGTNLRLPGARSGTAGGHFSVCRAVYLLPHRVMRYHRGGPPRPDCHRPQGGADGIVVRLWPCERAQCSGADLSGLHLPAQRRRPPLAAAAVLLGGQNRSGTTLLSVVLDAHPQLVVGPELDFTEPPDLGPHILAACELGVSSSSAASAISMPTPGSARGRASYTLCETAVTWRHRTCTRFRPGASGRYPRQRAIGCT